MTAAELKRLLAKHGCQFRTHHGGSGHITVTLGSRVTQLPVHGSGKDLGKGLTRKILKDLDIRL